MDVTLNIFRDIRLIMRIGVSPIEVFPRTQEKLKAPAQIRNYKCMTLKRNGMRCGNYADHYMGEQMPYSCRSCFWKSQRASSKFITESAVAVT